jgi:citrate synthase
MKADTTLYLTAAEAAAELGISRASLYAYVSRGKLRSVARSGSRARLYVAEDVRRLRQASAVDPGATTAQAQSAPAVLDSAITLISDQTLYYRGRDALRLAEAQSLEAVASLIWGATEDPFSEAETRIKGKPLPAGFKASELAVIDRTLLALAWQAPRDPFIHNLTPQGLARTGARVLELLIAAVLQTAAIAEPAHVQIARAHGLGAQHAEWVRSALVICADHELNPSTLAVRVVAGTRASLYRAVAAGLAALSGPEHGGMTERADALLLELAASRDPAQAVRDRLRRGEGLPGFGHPLYPAGDPRARFLLGRMLGKSSTHGSAATTLLASVVRAAREYSGLDPNLDFALSSLAWVLRLPPSSALGIFAIGRTVGWVGHALEQYQSGQRIRPRARYVGEHP